MKKGAEILGLPIISITEGRELGMSKTLVIDAKNGLVAAITVEDEEWYRGVKLIPYKDIIAIGEDAVTILHSNNILTLGQIGIYEPMLTENIKILETKAITKTGKIMGRIADIFVGDDGKIEKCEIRAADGSTSEISADKISIFSRQVTVIDMDGAKKIPPVIKPVEVPPVQKVEVKPVEKIQPVADVPTIPQVEEIPKVEEIVKSEEIIEPVEEIKTVAEIPQIEELPPVAEIPTEEIKPAEEIPPVENISVEEVKPVAEIPTIQENARVEEIETAAENPTVEDVPPVENIQPVEEIQSEEIPPISDISAVENEVDEPEDEVEMPDMSDFEPEPEPAPPPPPEPARGIQQAEVLKAALRRVTENQQKNSNPAAKTEGRKGGKTVTLVGRKVTKTITANNGSVIIEEGGEITEEILQKARIAGKFIELSMNSIA